MSNLQILPDETQLEIISFLPLRSILDLEQSNSFFKALSMSEKGQSLWYQKLISRFPHSQLFKSSTISPRDFYIQLAQHYTEIGFDPINFQPPIKMDDFEFLVKRGLHKFSNIDSGVIKYFIDCVMKFNINPQFIWKYLILNFSDLEMAKWYYDTYHISPDDFLNRIDFYDLVSIPSYKFEYIFTLMLDKNKLKLQLSRWLENFDENHRYEVDYYREIYDFLDETHESL